MCSYANMMDTLRRNAINRLIHCGRKGRFRNWNQVLYVYATILNIELQRTFGASKSSYCLSSIHLMFSALCSHSCVLMQRLVFLRMLYWYDIYFIWDSFVALLQILLNLIFAFKRRLCIKFNNSWKKAICVVHSFL